MNICKHKLSENFPLKCINCEKPVDVILLEILESKISIAEFKEILGEHNYKKVLSYYKEKN